MRVVMRVSITTEGIVVRCHRNASLSVSLEQWSSKCAVDVRTSHVPMRSSLSHMCKAAICGAEGA
jgi:hypothetical protein